MSVTYYTQYCEIFSIRLNYNLVYDRIMLTNNDKKGSEKYGKGIQHLQKINLRRL